MDREKLAKKFQWHIQRADELWMVRNFYDGRVIGKFQNYDEAFDRCNLLNAELALKGLDEWEPTHKHIHSDFSMMEVMKSVDVDGSEHNVYRTKDGKLVAYSPFELNRLFLSTPPKDMGGVK